MAIIQIEAPGQLQEFLQVLKKRRWQTLLPFGFILTLGVCFAVVVPRKYKVTTQVELRENVFDAGERRNVSPSTSLREAENAPYQIKALARIRSVVDQMKSWTDYMSLSPQDQHEYLLDIQEDIEVTMPPRLKTQGSTFVTISFRHTDPARAFEFLRGLRTAWIEQEVERDRNRLAAEYQGLLREEEELKKEIAAEERDFAQLRSDFNISPTQPSPSANQVRIEDPVFERLNEHQKELDAARIASGSLQATLDGLNEQLVGVPEQHSRLSTVGGVNLSASIQDQKIALSSLRSKLASYGRGHSRYGVLQKEILDAEKLLAETELQEEEATVREEWFPNPEFVELNGRLKVAELEQSELLAKIDHLEDVQALELEAAEERQEVYRIVRLKTADIARLVGVLDELESRLQYKKQVMDIMNGPTGNPFQITQEVVEPKEATEPDPWLISSISIVLGLAVGLASAMFGEYSRSCFRGAGDIGGVMVVPVLGVVNHIRTRGAIRRLRMRRALIGTSSFMIMGSFLFVTWAWNWSPDLLSDGLLDSIEVFRGWFR
jgi:capsular polysaccharide biosynthesis protein